MVVNAKTDSERFHSGADKYAAYLETLQGRLRLDLAFANVQEFLPRTTQPLRVLDVGCGTGAISVRLARLGFHSTLLDSSLPMLDLARRTALEADVIDKVELKHGDAAHLDGVFQAGSFDLILCHNVLEYFDDPVAVLRAVVLALRGPTAILSVLVRNQAGEVLKAAIQSGDLAAADHNLTSPWGQESLYGGKVRLFTPDGLRAMLKTASLEVSVERGVRIIADYLPLQVSHDADYERILELERKLGRRPEFAAVARYTHFLAHRADPGMAEFA